LTNEGNCGVEWKIVVNSGKQMQVIMRFWIDREDKERLENEAKMLGLNASSLLRLPIKQYFGGFHLEREKGEGQIEKVLTYKLRDG